MLQDSNCNSQLAGTEIARTSRIETRMKIVPPEPSVGLYIEGFEEPDILQRRKTGDALSDLLNRIDDPLVVALDGRWGTGKTYFLKRWAGTHEGATTVYFDAFAHDYVSDPLPALVSVLEERLMGLGTDGAPVKWEDIFPSMKDAAFRLAKPLARAGLTAVGAGVVVKAADELKKATDEEAANGPDGFWKAEQGRRQAMQEFSEAVETLAEPAGADHEGATVIFVIDELDRCRPDYALELLEVIKHFFAVPRVHFVLGVNLEALEGMVRARYGPDIDAHRYLGKFIHVRLDLPDEVSGGGQKKTMLAYLDHLVREMGIPRYIHDPLKEQIEIVARANHVSLRDVGSIVSSVSLASDAVVRNPENRQFLPGWIAVMNTLIISRTVRPDLHPRFLNATVTPADVESYLGTGEEELRPVLGNGRDQFLNVSILYHTWLYLSQHDGFNDYGPEFLDAIPNQFGRPPILEDPKTIPMTVHRQWLDRLSFYAPDQP